MKDEEKPKSFHPSAFILPPLLFVLIVPRSSQYDLRDIKPQMADG